MRRTAIVSVVLSCLAVGGGVAWWQESATPAAAVVSGEAISAEQLSAPIAGVHTPAARRAWLTRLIQIRLLTSLGVRYDVSVTESDVSSALAAAEKAAGGAEALRRSSAAAGSSPSGITDSIRLQLLRQRVLEAVLADPSIVGALAHNAYQRELPRLERVHLQEIVVPSLSTAERLRRQLDRAPQRFAELAHRFSADRVSAAHGGDVGELSRGQLQPDVAAAYTLPAGTIAVTRSAYGWLVFRVLSRHVPAYAEVAATLVSSVKATASAELLTRALAAESARLHVSVNRHIGRWQPDAAAVVR